MNVNILLIFAFVFVSDTSGDLPITQVITSITKKKGNTAFLECQIKKNILKKNVYIHWYQQKLDKPLKRILYISSNENVVHEQGISEERYEAKKQRNDLMASLRIHRVKEEDAGLYYCACWDTLSRNTHCHQTKNPPMPLHLCKHIHLLLFSTTQRVLTTVCREFFSWTCVLSKV